MAVPGVGLLRRAGVWVAVVETPTETTRRFLYGRWPPENIRIGLPPITWSSRSLLSRGWQHAPLPNWPSNITPILIQLVFPLSSTSLPLYIPEICLLPRVSSITSTDAHLLQFFHNYSFFKHYSSHTFYFSQFLSFFFLFSNIYIFSTNDNSSFFILKSYYISTSYSTSFFTLIFYMISRYSLFRMLSFCLHFYATHWTISLKYWVNIFFSIEIDDQ